MNKKISLILIIIFNAVPVFGVAFHNWQPFEAFWFYWVETLIISVFNTIRILFSQGLPPSYTHLSGPLVFNISKSLKYLFIRMAIFLFYSIFIIVFIGFIANSDKNEGSVLGTILFQNKIFNLGLLISFCSQCFYLITGFFKNQTFRFTSPDSFPAVFDGRQIVIHVAIVLGGLGSMLLSEKTTFGHLSGVLIISLLCICKCVYDIFESKNNSLKITNEPY